mmetsp:Transcript_17674/g.38140  ORF Transcript_17674/g.38140 Transcript_17674/m.38140 type:complete len:222 (-) Transcript_17674:627-1292(-)
MTTHVMSSKRPRSLTDSLSSFLAKASGWRVLRAIFVTCSSVGPSHSPSVATRMTKCLGSVRVVTAGSQLTKSAQSASPMPRATASPPGKTRFGPPGKPSWPTALPSLPPSALSLAHSDSQWSSRWSSLTSSGASGCSDENMYASVSPALQHVSSPRCSLTAQSVSVQPAVQPRMARTSACARRNASRPASCRDELLASPPAVSMNKSKRRSRQYIEATLPP